MDFLHRVQAVVILDEYGGRVFGKYYVGSDAADTSNELKSFEKQRALELLIHQAVRDPKRSVTISLDGDIMVIDGHAVLFSLGEDVTFVVIGDANENELVLYTALKALVDALKQALDTPDLSVRQLLEKYDAVLLAVDELLDDGIILETNAANIAAEIEPYIADTGSETARKALTTVNKYLRDNL